MKAIVFMNIFSIASACVSILFKYCNKNGVSVMEWMLWRNVFNLAAISGLLKYLDLNVVKNVPKGQMPWIWARGVVG